MKAEPLQRSPGLVDVKVVRRSRETAEIALIELVATEGQLPEFQAGDHIDLRLPNGLIRQYSLCSAPGMPDRYRLGVLLANRSRGGSRAVHALKVGETLQISRPRSAFPLDEGAEKTILVGGGIGITPMIAMAHRLSELGKDFELHYCARSRLHVAFRNELERGSFARSIRWRFDGQNGLTSFNPLVDLADPAPGKHLYVCGPKGFMKFVLDSAENLGWSTSNVHFESFEPPAPRTDDKGFHVVAKRSGIEADVPPGRTMASVLQEAGIKVSVSCEQGICGTCLVNVLEGLPDHRDTYQTGGEKLANRQVALCCSRALTPTLVLDM